MRALHKSAKQIGPLNDIWAGDAIPREGELRAVPGRLVHDGGHCPFNQGLLGGFESALTPPASPDMDVRAVFSWAECKPTRKGPLRFVRVPRRR